MTEENKEENKEENNLQALIKELDNRISKVLSQMDNHMLLKDTLIPALSLIVALTGILASTIVQYSSQRNQTDLKQYEVTFIAKQKSYSDFMSTMHATFFASTGLNKDDIFINLDRLQYQAFAIQPFLGKREQEKLWTDVQEVVAICINRFELYRAGEKNLEESTNKFLAKRESIRQWLMMNLFPENIMSGKEYK